MCEDSGCLSFVALRVRAHGKSNILEVQIQSAALGDTHTQF
jgi:hypothetical protein